MSWSKFSGVGIELGGVSVDALLVFDLIMDFFWFLLFLLLCFLVFMDGGGGAAADEGGGSTTFIIDW